MELAPSDAVKRGSEAGDDLFALWLESWRSEFFPVAEDLLIHLTG
ncbi:unnamed protein product [Protopolystoma xenopodis]|uniref:Uncharacterized protein n=1 Tax=Protopolystoma xenopodis TaxID=117903 RepID=A0A3S5APD0_9PLAT|nr:unnamed protein product [Protopolystoma xenopodis]